MQGRTQSVRFGSAVSDPLDVTSGVPQGSILGPLFYSLVASDFQTVFPFSGLCKYADDTTLILPIFKNSANTHIYTEHCNLLNWSVNHGLFINDDKCKSLFVRKANCNTSAVSLTGVKHVSELKLLGVTFNCNLTWSTHIDNIVRIASSRLHAIRILKPLISETHLIAAYSSNVRSILEYCCQLFVSISSTEATRLQNVQDRFHKIVHFDGCNCKLLAPLSERRVKASCKLYLKAHSDATHVLHHLIPRKICTFFDQPLCHTSRRLNSFIPFVTKIVNSNRTR